MATRGREADILYVDTRYDPDADTAHENIDHVPPEVVLRTVLATSGAALSATQTRGLETAAATNPARREAEWTAIQHHRRQQRYADLRSPRESRLST